MYIGFGLMRKYSTNELGKMGFFVKGIMKESGLSGSAMDEGYECELRTLMGLGRDFDYRNGFYALVGYIMSEKAKGAAHSLPQQPPQPAIWDEQPTSSLSEAGISGADTNDKVKPEPDANPEGSNSKKVKQKKSKAKTK